MHYLAHSIEERFDEISEESDQKIVHQNSMDGSKKPCILNDQEDGDDQKSSNKFSEFQRSVSPISREKIFSETDSGAMTSSSLDSSSSGGCFMRQISLDIKKRLDDSDRETE